ncbi:MAG: DNA-protecting protein DprA [Candidatus Delongbacteria bacterium]|nr:DNA-protecting protein DprA [Candidatus Delongbacteria bacterium]
MLQTLEIELALVTGANAHHYSRLLELAAGSRNPFQLPLSLLRREFPYTRWPSHLHRREMRRLAHNIATDLARGSYSRIAWHDSDYPELLRQIHSPPAQLFYRGQRELLQQPLWGIVGTRNASRAGREICRRFAREIAARGVVVVSGLARGIDTAAHQGALDGGSTIAVLGTGLDSAFPAENRELQDRIGVEGLLLSEFPPGAAVQGSNFPRRNRIVAGLVPGVLVGEAPVRSGALITARLALEENREVYALPGCIGDKRYAGNLHLLQQGALLAVEPEDLLTALSIDHPAPVAGTIPSLPPLTLSQAAVMECLAQETSLHVDELQRRTGLPPGELALLLMELEFAGHLQQLPGQYCSQVCR